MVNFDNHLNFSILTSSEKIHREEWIVKLFSDRPAFFLNIISTYYPLTELFLATNEDFWNWNYKWVHGHKNLSANKYLPWSIKLIEKFHEKWDWRELSRNPAIPWSNELIEKFHEKWDWSELSRNQSLNWSDELLEKYKDKWDWAEFSNNQNLPWSIPLIKKYKSNWDWGKNNDGYDRCLNGLSGNDNPNFPWSIELIENFKNELYWPNLSKNHNLPWSIELIEKYSDKWNWGVFGLSTNPKLHLTFESFEKLKDKLVLGDSNYYGLSGFANLPWSIDFIENNIWHKWNWQGLSKNQNLPWSVEFIENYINRWDWEALSINKALPWSIEFIEHFEENWSYNGLNGYSRGWRGGLSSNVKLPWTLELIEKYKEKWDWDSLSKNKKLPWTIELIEKFNNKWNWNLLINNSEVPWSIDLILKFRCRLPVNISIWEKVFRPVVNDAIIEVVLGKIKIHNKVEHVITRAEKITNIARRRWDRKKSEANFYNLTKCLRRSGNFSEAKKLHEELKLSFNTERIKNEFLCLEKNELWNKEKNETTGYNFAICLIATRNYTEARQFHKLLKTSFNTTRIQNELPGFEIFNLKILDIYKFYQVKLYKLETQLDFGKFKGKTVNEILIIQSSYINFCLLKVAFFCIPEEVLKIIEENNNFISFTNSAKNKNEEKYKKWIEQELHGKTKQLSQIERDDSLYDYSEYGYADDFEEFEQWSGMSTSYNDNLDIDQQSEGYHSKELDKEKSLDLNDEDYDDNPLYNGTGINLIEYAKSLDAYEIILVQGLIKGTFVEIYKGKSSSGNLFLIQTLPIKSEITTHKINNLQVHSEFGKYFCNF